MTPNETHLYLLASELEFRALLDRLGHPDASTRSFTMTAELASRIARWQRAWQECSKEAKP